MKHIYKTPSIRRVAFMPEALLESISTPYAYKDEDPDERGPQSTRGFDWDNNNGENNYWND